MVVEKNQLPNSSAIKDTLPIDDVDIDKIMTMDVDRLDLSQFEDSDLTRILNEPIPTEPTPKPKPRLKAKRAKTILQEPTKATIRAVPYTPPRTETVPQVAKGWNWGACALTPLWALSMNLYWVAILWFISLSMFHWVGSIIFSLLIGGIGQSLAWKSKHWHDVDHFKRTQKIWNQFGKAALIVILIIFALYFIGIMNPSTPPSEIIKVVK